jgi:hypothetical protein
VALTGHPKTQKDAKENSLTKSIFLSKLTK